MAVGLVFLASSHCQICNKEGLCSSMSVGTTARWIRPPYDGSRISDYSSIRFNCRNPFFGGVHSYGLSGDLRLSKARVAADYPDSVPDSSKYVENQGYHPLEELKERKKDRDTLLTDAEIARTTAEANSNALLVFPGRVHSEPHGHVSWAEYQYVVDDYGDIYFEFLDDENILQDCAASNPVTVLIGMNGSIYGETRMVSGSYSDYLDVDTDSDISSDDDSEIGDTEVSDTLIKWGMPDTLHRIHPIFFAKCLTKAAQTKYGKKMDCPSNGLSIIGCLRPAFLDEESYLRRLFHHEEGDGYSSEDRDGEILSFGSRCHGGNISSTLYKLEVIAMDLLTIYGDQMEISLQDFQDAEPDVLAHSAPVIIDRFSEFGTQCGSALRALCRKKKGLIVEGATLIGVDSLGMDVRVFSGIEARTVRFSFSSRAMSESAAEKKIKRMLFPHYHRKSSRTHSDGPMDSNSS